MQEIHISMEEDTSLVWRKSKISMQEDREVQGKSTIRIIPNIVYYSTPRKLTSWDGIRHDFSGWGQNPRSTKSFKVSSTVVRHSV